jgi:hypothetical protein
MGSDSLEVELQRLASLRYRVLASTLALLTGIGLAVGAGVRDGASWAIFVLATAVALVLAPALLFKRGRTGRNAEQPAAREPSSPSPSSTSQFVDPHPETEHIEDVEQQRVGKLQMKKEIGGEAQREDGSDHRVPNQEEGAIAAPRMILDQLSWHEQRAPAIVARVTARERCFIPTQRAL